MFLDSFYYIPNNDENVSHKISKFDKEKTRGKEHNSSQSAKSKESSNDLGVLDRVRLNNADRVIIGHLNINSLRNKFEMLRETVQDKLDILLISETKGDPLFPSSQFAIEEGFSSPFRLDRNSSGGGIMLFVREELPSKPLSKYKQNSSVENIFIEKKLRSKKWLLSCSYNPNLTLLNNHIQNISKGLDFYSSKYGNFIVLGDFNAETSNTTISEFCATNLKILIKEPTCFKILENPTCIDLILTNRLKCFQNSNVFETRLSDFHKLTFTVLKAYFQKQKPKVIKYRNY